MSFKPWPLDTELSQAMAEGRRRGRLVWLTLLPRWNAEACAWADTWQGDSQLRRREQDFVRVELDPALHPTLDQGAQTFLGVAGGRGGWPLNLFIDPHSGLAIFGATALDPEKADELLRQLLVAWELDPEAMRNQAREHFDEFCARDPLQVNKKTLMLTDAQVEAELSEKTLAAAMAPLEQSLDWETGFVGQGDVFLYPGVYRMLLRNSRRIPFGEKALASLARSHLCDGLGGGFFRAAGRSPSSPLSTEKLLIENAEMLETLLTVRSLKSKEFLARLATEMIESLGADFLLPEGNRGWASSLSASSRYYEWRPRDLLEALEGNERQAAQSFFGIEGSRLVPTLPTELPLLARRLNVPPVDLRNELIRARTKLVAYRKERRGAHQPQRAQPFGAGNAVALRSLAEAGSLGMLPRNGVEATYEFCEAQWQSLGLNDRRTPASPRELWSWAAAALSLARWSAQRGDRSARLLDKIEFVDRWIQADEGQVPSTEFSFLGRRWDLCDHLGASAGALRARVYHERWAWAVLEGDVRGAERLRPQGRRVLAESLHRVRSLGLFAAQLYDTLSCWHPGSLSDDALTLGQETSPS